MNDTTAAERIIELAMKWQNKFEWEQAYEAADSSRKERDRANQNWAVVHRMQDVGQRSEMLEFRHDAERHQEMSEHCHQHVIAASQELIDLKHLVRTHAPKLLEYVPEFNFFFDPPDADLSQRIRDLKTLEGKVRDSGAVPVYSRHRRVDEWLAILKTLGHEMSEDTFLRRRTGKAVPKIGVNPNSTRSSISLLIADLPDGYTGEMTP